MSTSPSRSTSPKAWDAQFEVAVVEALNNAVKHGNPAKRDDACRTRLTTSRM